MSALYKWKYILRNWINCYPNENKKREQCVSLESLLTIISHLRDNLTLDESKSSILEAHTLEEFITEKYPEFKFDNGTIEAINEEELYVAASLLLFFVCVNSKDVCIKNAMCSKLNPEDQEIILKFNKSLMECSPISYKDVQAAIREACGQDVGAAESLPTHVKVAETPPALRSLHSEVLRLQAALDAERFDKNYLQEELSRNTLRMEKLLKDKEQYKLDIVNLKTKISMCCGDEGESRGDDVTADSTARLTRQLQDLEERQGEIQTQLDNVHYERDIYKAKIDELKKERDKWLSSSQLETTRAGQLADELETERRQVQSLQELVMELRQHHQKNRLDVSQLECDDLDASMRSLHNVSVCSEACANVIEVQLGEERAKIVVLKQQIQMMQDQLNELTQKSECEKKNLEGIISEKDDDIFNLKHRINKEIEEKNNIESQFDDKFIKLNNKINELEQKLKDNTENSRVTIQEKNQEIQTLQEEKLSLTQSFSDKTTKLENVIRDLENQIDTEKNLKLKMKDDYENHMMKLNEKVLNRNNELVELQNNVFDKSEMIEQMHMDLRKEREALENLANKYHSDIAQLCREKAAAEKNMQTKTAESNELQRRLLQNVAVFADLNKEIDDLKESNESISKNCKTLEENNTSLQSEMQNRVIYIEELQKEIEHKKHELDDRNATIDTLKMQLQDEIQYKTQLINELKQLKDEKVNLSQEIKTLNIEFEQIKKDVHEKDRIMYATDLYLKEEKHINKSLKHDCERLNRELQKCISELDSKDKDIKMFQDKLENECKLFEEEICKRDDIIESHRVKLMSESEERQKIQDELNKLKNEKFNLDKELDEKCGELSLLKADYEIMSEIIEKRSSLIDNLEKRLKEENVRYMDLERNYETQTCNLLSKLGDTEKYLQEYDLSCKDKELQNESLKLEISGLQQILDTKSQVVQQIEKEKKALAEKLNEEIMYKTKLEKEYLNLSVMFDNIKAQLISEISLKNNELLSLKDRVELLSRIVEDKNNDIGDLQEKLYQEIRKSADVMHDKDAEFIELQKKIDHLSFLNHEYELKLKKEIAAKMQAIETLQKENEQLHFTMEEDNSNHEIILKEKDKIIERLEDRLKISSIQLENIRKDYEAGSLVRENFKIEIKEKLEMKDSQIIKLEEQVIELKLGTEKHKADLKRQLDNVVKDSKESDIKYKEQIIALVAEVSRNEQILAEHDRKYEELLEQLENEKAVRDCLESEKQQLLSDKDQIFRNVGTEMEELLSEKNMLKQQLMEAKSVRQLIEEQLQEEIEIKNTILDEKEGLAQQFVEAKSLRQLIEEQLQEEIEIKNTLLDEKECLAQQFVEVTSAKEVIEQEKEILRLTNEELKAKLSDQETTVTSLEKENTNLNNDKDSLAQNLRELTTIQDILVKDKDTLFNQKESIITSLTEEKSARDKLETEKAALRHVMDTFKENVTLDLSTKQEEIDTMSKEFYNLRTDFKKLEEVHVRVCTVLNSGTEKVIQNIKNEDICNEVLQKLINLDNDDLSINEKCYLLVNITDVLASELAKKKILEKALEDENTALNQMQDMLEEKELEVQELKSKIHRLEQSAFDITELYKNTESYKSILETKCKELQAFQAENQTLKNELNDVKVQLDVRVHSLKEKLVDNEILTDKLKKTYDFQIDNLNVMITKLTSYLKDKALELETSRKEIERLQKITHENNEAIKLLEEEVRTEKQNQDKLLSDFESERLVLKNMVTVTESVMEDQKQSLKKVISEYLKANEVLQQNNGELQEKIEAVREEAESKYREKESLIRTVYNDVAALKKENEKLQTTFDDEKYSLNKEIKLMMSCVESLEAQNKDLANNLRKYKDNVTTLEQKDNEMKIKKDSFEFEVLTELNNLTTILKKENKHDHFLHAKLAEKKSIEDKIKVLCDEVIDLFKTNHRLEQEKVELKDEFERKYAKGNEEIEKLDIDNKSLRSLIEENKSVITNLEQLIKHELEQHQKLRADTDNEKSNLETKFAQLQEYQLTKEKQIEERDMEIATLKENVNTVSANCAKHWNSIAKSFQTNAERLEEEVQSLKAKIDAYELKIKEKDEALAKIAQEKDVVERAVKERYQKELESKAATVYELRQKLEEVKSEAQVLQAIKKENDEMLKAVGQREIYAASLERSHKYCTAERESRDRHQVSTPTSDLGHSSVESFKTITDLEKIIHDKNRTITTLQSDVTYLKSLMAESENRLLDVTKELADFKDNCEQLSKQLKKIVNQKNEEIAELKKHVTKMSVTDNRATQIIKVSAKYQAIILKRIAEIKSNTILKELTNIGNTANCDTDLRRSLNSGAITMEDLENFLETTDRHLKRCSEKQIALTKERDRLIEVNKINESEIINLKKFLTELTVGIKTFSSVKDLYSQKLTRVVSIQRTVRREILNLEGLVTDSMMCKLERGYAAVMQDLSECAMNLERWVDRSISRTISPEKIKQAFSSEVDNSSMASTTFQNTSLEVQLEELENSFKKLLEEVARSTKGDGARDTQAATVMEVRAEYEDKLSRMKAKMKQLYQEQIAIFKEKQREEIATLERELMKAREKHEASNRDYENHIRSLTTELWNVGEKFLMKKDEAEWLRKKQHSGSLMSLQHVHSSGLEPHFEQPSRPSDSHSLRSLPVKPDRERREKRDSRGLHMSDEEGEVFDNRWLKELAATPRRERSSLAPAPGQRLSELRWRNSLCPPHLKSSYPAETQFSNTIDEDDIKCQGAVGGKPQRKEVGITAYKKPGPPTPSKQAGRLSATDSELREYLRVDTEPQPARKTSTPSRIRALFRSSKTDATEGTPRSRRLSIFRKK